MREAGCYYILCKNTCVCEVNKLERRFYLVDAQVLPEVFLKVVRAKELLASGEARSISAATRSVDLSRSAFYKYKEQGFGPIVTEQDELVTRLCHLMDTNGKNEQQYIDRANDFFAFDDYSNCSRIYKTVDEYMKVSGLVEYTLKEKIENKCKKNGKK